MGQSRYKHHDAAWLAMPRYSVELVAQANRFEAADGLDVLNDGKVTLYLEVDYPAAFL